MTTLTNTNYHTAYDGYDSKLFLCAAHDESYQGKLNTINNILDDCVVRVNFWGAREIVSKSGVGMPIMPLALDTIVQRIRHAAFPGHPMRNSNVTGLNQRDLIAQNEIVEKLKNFYTTSDVQVANSNCITRLFDWIREQLSVFNSENSWYCERWSIIVLDGKRPPARF
jgi:5'(3')-deoxyribonucleotidase